ncbi:methyl-accepting chemotaxis protein [Bacillaceae bacterium SAS-127]|nr:methyl-accepting chemotaxis protein [Bacillaceae bacterium SAS-127]
MRNKLISTRITLIFMTVMAVVFLSVVFLLIRSSYGTVEKTIGIQGTATAKHIAERLNGDTYGRFIEKPEENESYFEVKDQLIETLDSTGVLYIYTLRADEKSVQIMMDGYPKDSKDGATIGQETTGTTYDDVKPVLEGKTTSTKIINDPQYGRYLSAFAPIKDSNGEIVGILGVDIAADSVVSIQSELLKSSIPIFGITFLLLIIVVCITLYFYVKRTLAPLSTVSQALGDFADGRWSVANQRIATIRTNKKDEISSLVRSFSTSIEQLSAILSRISSQASHLQVSSNKLFNTVEETQEANRTINQSMDEVASGSSRSVQNNEEAVRAMEEMSLGVQKIADSATTMAETSSGVTEFVQNCHKESLQVVNQIQDVKTLVLQTGDKVEDLTAKYQQIQDITNVMTGIAEQTNLLALNAAIEAARAGEYGKGFAVVADEVRHLAEQSKHSAEEIRVLIESFAEVTNGVRTDMTSTSTKVTNGAQAVQQIGEMLKEIYQSVSSVNDEVQETSATTEEMSAGSEEILASLEQVTDYANKSRNKTIEVAASTEQQIKAMESLAK